MTFYLTVDEVIAFHDAEVSESGGLHGIMSLSGLESAILRPQSGFGGEELYPTLEAKAAAMFESLIRNHGFCDGNKRTALLVTELFLNINGVRLDLTEDELVQLAVDTASGRLTYEDLERQFQQHSVAFVFDDT